MDIGTLARNVATGGPGGQLPPQKFIFPPKQFYLLVTSEFFITF